MTDVDGTPSALLLGHSIRVVVDGVGLLRWIRATLAEDGGQGPATIVSTVLRVLDGKLTPDDRVVTSLAEDIGDCLGILPGATGPASVPCTRSCAVTCCPRPTPRGSSRHSRPAGLCRFFSPGPFGAACSRMVGGAGRRTRHGPPDGRGPDARPAGRRGPVQRAAEDLAAATGGVPGVYTLAIPNMAYNVLSNGCVRTIRDAWLDAPTGPPADTSCLAQI